MKQFDRERVISQVIKKQLEATLAEMKGEV